MYTHNNPVISSYKNLKIVYNCCYNWRITVLTPCQEQWFASVDKIIIIEAENRGKSLKRRSYHHGSEILSQSFYIGKLRTHGCSLSGLCLSLPLLSLSLSLSLFFSFSFSFSFFRYRLLMLLTRDSIRIGIYGARYV
jgi:hypothetical protein